MTLLHERLGLSLDEVQSQLSLSEIATIDANGTILNFTKPIENLFPICPVAYAESMIKFLDLKKNGEVQSMMDYLMLYNKVESLISVSPFETPVRLVRD